MNIELLTNIDKRQLKHHRICAEVVGLQCFEVDAARDVFGKPIPEDYAVYVLAEPPQREKIMEYYRASRVLRNYYKRCLKRSGVTDEMMYLKFVYIDCEQEHFPEFTGKINWDFGQFMTEWQKSEEQRRERMGVK